jgi:hypothetical protein
MPPPRSLGSHARWFLAATLVALVATVLPPSARADNSTWTAPVPGAVVREYREPPARFASGHRGVDFAAPAGTPVRAASDGRVTFAGTVSGSLHVVVEHTGGVRTSYSFLARIDVDEGSPVRRGDILGAAGGSGGGHRRGVLHFGARAGARYFDPMLLFGPTDLTELVRLVPAGAPTPSDETLILRELQDDGDDCAGGIPFVEQLCDAGEAVGGFVGDTAEGTWDLVEDAVDLGLAALRSVVAATRDLIDRVERTVRDVLQTLRDVANEVVGAIEDLAVKIANGAVEVFNAVVEAGIELIEQLTSCPQPPPLAHPKGSGNLVIAVGGLNSSRQAPKRDALAPSFDFDWRALGYDRSDVEFFSYARGTESYAKRDTYGDLHAKAELLGTQIQDWARANPGRSLDLVGHSQGGVVIDMFLLDVYRGREGEYPPIENVVTFASPHEGTPLADFEVSVEEHLLLGPIAREIAGPDQATGALSVRQLREESGDMFWLWRERAVPPSVRFLSIVGAEDPVVPSTSVDVPGGTTIVVPTGAPLLGDDHSAVLTDVDAISAAQAHLSGRAPADSCGPFTNVGGAVYSEVLRAGASFVTTFPSQGKGK